MRLTPLYVVPFYKMLCLHGFLRSECGLLAKKEKHDFKLERLLNNSFKFSKGVRTNDNLTPQGTPIPIANSTSVNYYPIDFDFFTSWLVTDDPSSPAARL